MRSLTFALQASRQSFKSLVEFQSRFFFPKPYGFGKKNRDWNSTKLLKDWREAWSAKVNERMAELGLEGRIDHRSYEAQGIALEPQHKIGPAASRRPEQGLEAERIEDHTR